MPRLTPRTGTAAWLAAVACLALGPRTPAQTPSVPRPLRLGTFNLEQLGARQPPRTVADFQAIAALIHAAKIDVLAVQEVNGPKPLHTLLRFLGADFRFCLGTTGEARQPLRVLTNIGFVWNSKRVMLTQCEELLDIERRAGDVDLFFRAPICGVFRVVDGDKPPRGFKQFTRLDFRAVAVHLTEGTGRRAAMARRGEVLALRRYLEQLQGLDHEDPDVVFLGTFAHGYTDAAHDAFTEGGKLQYLRNAEQVPTCLPWPEPQDHIAVTPSLAAVAVPGSFKVHDDLIRPPPDLAPARRKDFVMERKTKWRQIFSDHFPVTVDLDLSRDRDPDLRFRGPQGYTLSMNAEGTPEYALDSSPFVAGVKVQVRLVATHPGPHTVTGTLLAPPGAWVVVRIGTKIDKAYPAGKVLEIVRVD